MNDYIELNKNNKSSDVKICLFLPNLCIGGAERSAVNIANGFEKKGYKVDVVLADKRGDYIKDLNENVNIINLNKKKVSTCIFELSKYIKLNNPKCIISFMDHCNIVAILSNKISGNTTKTISTIHSTISQRKYSLKNELMKKIQKIVYKYVYKIVVVSKEAGNDARNILKIPKQKIRVIYNPIVTEDMFLKSKQKISHKWIGSKKYFNIIGVGRLTDEKGFDDLIKAFEIVKKNNENIRLTILGEGANRKKLEMLIGKLNLTEYIDLPGFVNPYPYMKLANLFVLSSRREGLPSALIESMALGTRVISTNCKSGPREILKDGKLGALIDVGSISSMAAEIEKSIRCNKTIDYKDYLYEFTEKSVIDEYIQVIYEEN